MGLHSGCREEKDRVEISLGFVVVADIAAAAAAAVAVAGIELVRLVLGGAIVRIDDDEVEGECFVSEVEYGLLGHESLAHEFADKFEDG